MTTNHIQDELEIHREEFFKYFLSSDFTFSSDEEYKEKLLELVDKKNPYAIQEVANCYLMGLHGFEKNINIGFNYYNTLNEQFDYIFLFDIENILWNEESLRDGLITMHIYAVENNHTSGHSFANIVDDSKTQSFYKELFEYCYPRYLGLALSGSYGACVVLSNVYGDEWFPGREECGIKRDVLLSDYFKKLSEQQKEKKMCLNGESANR